MGNAISEMEQEGNTKYLHEYQTCEFCGSHRLHWLRSDRPSPPHYKWDCACEDCGYQKGFEEIPSPLVRGHF